ncbi:NAD-P-binding protein [Trametes maxima]|nr:NAD-P-binding protein [Trametes maxima]
MFSYMFAGCYAVASMIFGTISPAQPTVNVFIVGATGYVGGSVLGLLLEDHNGPLKYNVTALVRGADKAKKLESFGVNSVIGSLDDLDKLETIASESDVVIECADADHIGSTKAFLAGFKRRHELTGKTPILIHTSGTAVLSDNAAGMYNTSTIYHDADNEQMDTIAPTQPHRNVDLTVAAADKEGYVKTYIVLPSTIYGLAAGPLVDAGIVNPRSMQIPALIRASLDRKQAGMVGEGRNIHPNVHIDDGQLHAFLRREAPALTSVPFSVSRLYTAILAAALLGADVGHGREGFYFAENGEHTLLDIAQAIGAALKDMGHASSAEPSTFTREELDKYFGGSESLGTNVRCRAERGRALGWTPLKTSEDMLLSIKPEIEDVLSWGRKA